jgi:hypothetical protein
MSQGLSAVTPAARRIDWRFLLPVPPSFMFDKVVLVDADEDLVRAFEATGLAAKVDTRLGEHDADLVAVCWPSTANVKDVVNATRPGGLIYIEVDRRAHTSRALTPGRLSARLVGEGASVEAQYALRPAPDRCELYVPLDRSGAIRWFLSSVYIASTPLKRIGETTLRVMAGSDARRIGAVAPFHATVAAVPTSAQQREPDLRTRSIATLIHGGGRVVQIEFSDQSPGLPLVVTKIPKLQTAEQRTRHEHMMVARIQQAIGPPENETLPTPRAIVDSSAGPIAVEDGAPGSSLARLSSRWGRSSGAKAEDLRLATSWLIRLHRDHMIGQGNWTEDRRIAFLDRPLAAFATRFGTTEGEAALFDATRAVAADLLGHPLPVVWEHGDYSIWNIFRDGDRIRVLDWEHSRVGVPLADVIRLATHWHEAVRGLVTADSRWQGFADLFAGGGKHPATKEALAAVLRYEEALDIDPRFRSMLLVMSRVELAVRRFEHQSETAILHQDDVRAGNAALAYISTLVERRNDLFPIV